MARKYAAKVDRNQSAIVGALRAVGASVQPLHAVGGGVPDLLVGFRGKTLLIEVKDGEASPSGRKLTDHQVEWHDKWRGQVAVAYCEDDALRILGVESYRDLHTKLVGGE